MRFQICLHVDWPHLSDHQQYPEECDDVKRARQPKDDEVAALEVAHQIPLVLLQDALFCYWTIKLH